MVVGNWNIQMIEPSLEEFFQTYNLSSIVNRP